MTTEQIPVWSWCPRGCGLRLRDGIHMAGDDLVCPGPRKPTNTEVVNTDA